MPPGGGGRTLHPGIGRTNFPRITKQTGRKFLNTPAEADEAIAGLRRVSSLVTLAGKSGWVAADQDDDKLIEAALVGGADAGVSGDHHLRDLGRIEKIPILRPRQFLDRRGGVPVPFCRPPFVGADATPLPAPSRQPRRTNRTGQQVRAGNPAESAN